MQAHGPAIRALRELAGLNASEFARLTGIERTHLRRIEMGQRRGTDAQIVAIARALRVPTTAVIREPDEAVA